MTSPTIILGHNQFIGVHYSDTGAGRAKASYFREVGRVIDIIEYSADLGVKGVMFSTNDLTREVVKGLKGSGITFYPILPYMRKYATEASRKGVINLVYDIIRDASWAQKARIAVKGSTQLLNRDPFKILETLIDVELLPFEGAKLGTVFLHNEITNLALAIGAKEVLLHFRDHVEDKYDAEAGFGTGNLCAATRKLGEWGVERPAVMAPFNTLGFLMSESLENNEMSLKSSDVRLFAMSTLAGGRLSPQEAYRYILQLPRLDSIIVGYSTRSHAKETIDAIRSTEREASLTRK